MPTSRRVSQVGLTRTGGRSRTARARARRSLAALTRNPEPNGPAPAVGQVLRRAREYQDLSLREVERKIGRSNAYLSQVERGVIQRPDPVVLFELANLYGLDFMQLAEWAGWSEEGPSGRRTYSDDSLRQLLKLVVQLGDSQRNEVLAYVHGLLRADRT